MQQKRPGAIRGPAAAQRARRNMPPGAPPCTGAALPYAGESIREGKANLNDAFCTFIDNQLYVRNLHIAEYSYGSFYNHEAKRDRVLLLNKKELKKLQTRGEEKGLTIVPLALFISERGFAKLEIGLAQGKKTFDKRETMKERDTKVEMDRALKR